MPANKTSLERMRMANERADISLRSHLEELGKIEKVTISVMDKEFIQLRMELRANRSRELCSVIREEMNKNDTQVKVLREIKPRRISLVDLPRNSIGEIQFDKLSSDEIRRPRERHRSSMQKRYIVLPEDTASSSGEGKNYDERHDSDETQQRIKIRRRRIPKSTPHTIEPSYMKILEAIRADHYDQYTDGTMALAMRRFQYRQKEVMPSLSGYLSNKRKPCKRTTTTTGSDTRGNQSERAKGMTSTLPMLSNKGRGGQSKQEENIESGIAKTRLPTINANPTNKGFIPKHIRLAKNNDDEKEHQKLLRIRKADEMEAYRKSLEKLNNFLGEIFLGTPSIACS